MLRRLWDAVAPGGHLVIQDYDVRSAGVEPPLATVEEFKRVVLPAFAAAGCDVHVGTRLPELFARAGIGAPDGTDVAGRLEPLADAQGLFTGVYSGVLATAIAHGLTTQERAARVAHRVRARRRAPPRAPGALAAAHGSLEAQAADVTDVSARRSVGT